MFFFISSSCNCVVGDDGLRCGRILKLMLRNVGGGRFWEVTTIDLGIVPALLADVWKIEPPGRGATTD